MASLAESLAGGGGGGHGRPCYLSGLEPQTERKKSQKINAGGLWHGMSHRGAHISCAYQGIHDLDTCLIHWHRPLNPGPVRF